jgi:hypothetical protein
MRLRRELVLDADALLSRRCNELVEPSEVSEVAVREDVGFSLPSSLECSCGLRGVWVCIRACRRMLLRTLKLRPQLSTGQTKAANSI